MISIRDPEKHSGHLLSGTFAALDCLAGDKRLICDTFPCKDHLFERISAPSNNPH